jgi:hypothetical protein
MVEPDATTEQVGTPGDAGRERGAGGSGFAHGGRVVQGAGFFDEPNGFGDHRA